MPKIYSYKCDTCLRSIDLEDDGKRPSLLRCVITNKCVGFLSLTAQHKGTTAASDRQFRGAVEPASITPAVPETPVSLMVGDVLALACLTRTLGADTTFEAATTAGTVTVETLPALNRQPVNVEVRALLFELAPDVLQKKHLTYDVRVATTLLTGQDSSPERRALRFQASDLLKVFLNGVELDSSEYDRSILNQLTFPAALTLGDVVDVYVYKNISSLLVEETNLVYLSFVPLATTSTTRQQIAWGDAGLLESEVAMLYCSDISELDSSKSYGVKRWEVIDENGVTHELDPSSVKLLLSDYPNSFVDKRLDTYVRGDAFTLYSISYQLNKLSGALELSTTVSAVTKLFTRLKVLETVAGLTDVNSTLTAKQDLAPAQAFVIGPA